MQERLIAAVDLGTSKIAVTVAKESGSLWQVIYHKKTTSDGIRYGSVYNPKKVSVHLRTAIQEAEDEIGMKISQVVVGLPRFGVSQNVTSAPITRSNPDEFISEEDIATVKSMAGDSYILENPEKNMIYGITAQSYSTDDTIQAPESEVVGMTSAKLEGIFKVFIGPKKAASNIDWLLNDCNVAIGNKYFLPEAIGNIVLSTEELENGAALFEMGAGVSSVSIFQGGTLRYYGAIPFGGESITGDIKMECNFHKSLAENIKQAYGACLPDKIPVIGEKIIQINDEQTGESEQLPIKYLAEIINGRAVEIVQALLYLVQESGYADRLRSGIVITGGGAELVGLASMIKEMSGYSVRVGYPRTQAIDYGAYRELTNLDAAASTALILLASKENLNCCTDLEHTAAPQVEPDPVVTGQSEPVVNDSNVEKKAQPKKNFWGGLFGDDDDEKPEPKPVKKPEPKPAPKPKPVKPATKRGSSFIDKIAGGIEHGAESTFDTLFGSLYDEAGGNTETEDNNINEQEEL